jgi:hypothetical protein
MSCIIGHNILTVVGHRCNHKWPSTMPACACSPARTRLMALARLLCTDSSSGGAIWRLRPVARASSAHTTLLHAGSAAAACPRCQSVPKCKFSENIAPSFPSIVLSGGARTSGGKAAKAFRHQERRSSRTSSPSRTATANPFLPPTHHDGPHQADRTQEHRWQGPAQAARHQGGAQVRAGERRRQEAAPLPARNCRSPRDPQVSEEVGPRPPFCVATRGAGLRRPRGCLAK